MSHLRRVRLVVGILALLTTVPGGWTPVAGDAPRELWAAAKVTRLSQPGPAPPLGLSDLSGQTVDLADFRGRIVMLYFWATW